MTHSYKQQQGHGSGLGIKQDESHSTLMKNNKVTDQVWETNKGQGLMNHSYEQQQGHRSGMGNQQGS